MNASVIAAVSAAGVALIGAISGAAVSIIHALKAKSSAADAQAAARAVKRFPPPPPGP